MPEPLSRRALLKQLGCAGAGVAFGGGILRGQSSPILVAGRPVEIAVLAVSPATVRITALPIDGVVPDDGALVPAAAGRMLSTRRSAGSATALRAGDLRVAFSATPPALEIVTANGAPVQRLTFNEKSGGVTFSLGRGPLLGFGEGGAQFDRRGVVDRMRNGQGGYQLRTHGGRVPIQWLIGTDGWGLFIHQPLGSFDLTGPYGTLTPIAEAPPFDIFVTASSEPAEIVREYARITGFAELPARWTFGYMQSHRTLAGPDEVRCGWRERSARSGCRATR